MAKPNDLVQGTLDFLILKTISLEPKHGWAIAKRIQQISGEVLQVQQGSLYPAYTGWSSARGSKPNGRKPRRGTGSQVLFADGAGRAQLEREGENSSRLSAAINLVVETT